MWKDRIETRYWWHEAKDAIDQLLYELAKAEDEEELSYYVLNLHQKNKDDFNCFSGEENKEIKRLLSVLVHQTDKHRKLLNEIMKELNALRDPNGR